MVVPTRLGGACGCGQYSQDGSSEGELGWDHGGLRKTKPWYFRSNQVPIQSEIVKKWSWKQEFPHFAHA
jgi:hypothetical protein